MAALLLRDLEAAGLPRLCGGGAVAGRCDRGGDARDGPVPARRDEAQSGSEEFPPVQPGREQLQPLAGRARSDQPRLGRRDTTLRRPSRARRAGDGDAERAPVPGLAGRLSAHRPARLLLLLRGLHPHHRFDVQPARQVARRSATTSRGAGRSPRSIICLSQPRLAAGPQRLLHQDPGFIDHVDEQEGGGRARLSAAGRELPALGHRPLPAQPELRQRDRRRQAAGAAMADHGSGDQALRRGRRASGSGRATTKAASPTS